MHKFKRVLLVLLLVFAIGFMTGCKKEESLESIALNYFETYPEAGSNLISWTDLFAKIEAGDDLFILSLRSKVDYDLGHIEGAYNAAFGADLAVKVKLLPTDKPVYVYCYSGQTAGQAIALLRLLGIDAYSVKSGFNVGGAATHTEYISKTANELPDAKASFNKEALKFVEDYLNAIPTSGNHMISADDARPLIEAGDVSVVDIRSAADFALGHIEGAVNIPFGKGMQANFKDLPDGRIIVACYSGQTASQTVVVLRALGHNADVLTFGMSATSNGWVKSLKTNAANKYFSEYPVSGSYLISWDDLFVKIDANENPFILSIRSAIDYNLGHVEGAVNASFGADLASKVSMLPKDKPVYVYCYSGQTAGQTIALLRLLGIDAYSVKSGYSIGEVATKYPTRVSTVANTLVDAKAKFDPFMLDFVKSYFNAIPVSGSHMIGSVDAKVLIDAKEITVVDVRSAVDFEKGHIEGAVNIPFGKGMQENFKNLPAGRLLVACYSGQTAAQVTAILRTLGYDADALTFGMSSTLNGWYKNFPIVD